MNQSTNTNYFWTRRSTKWEGLLEISDKIPARSPPAMPRRLQTTPHSLQHCTACNTARPATLHGLQHHTACNTVPSAKSKRATRELENDGQYICIIQFGKGFMTMRNIDDRKKRRKKEKSQPSERRPTAAMTLVPSPWLGRTVTENPPKLVMSEYHICYIRWDVWCMGWCIILWRENVNDV